MLKTFLIPKPVKVNKTYLLGCDNINNWTVFTNRSNTIIGYTQVYVVPKGESIPNIHRQLYNMDNYLSYRVTETPIYLDNFHYYEMSSGVEFNLNSAAVNFNTHKVWVLFVGAPSHYDSTIFIPQLDHQIYEFTSLADFSNTEYTTGDTEITTAGYIPLHLGGSYWYYSIDVDSDIESYISDLGAETCSISISNNSVIGNKQLSDYIINSDNPDYWDAICVKQTDINGNLIGIELRIPYEETKLEIYGSDNPIESSLEYETYIYGDQDSAAAMFADNYYTVYISSDVFTIDTGKAPVMVSDSRGPIYE